MSFDVFRSLEERNVFYTYELFSSMSARVEHEMASYARACTVEATNDMAAARAAKKAAKKAKWAAAGDATEEALEKRKAVGPDPEQRERKKAKKEKKKEKKQKKEKRGRADGEVKSQP